MTVDGASCITQSLFSVTRFSYVLYNYSHTGLKVMDLFYIVQLRQPGIGLNQLVFQYIFRTELLERILSYWLNMKLSLFLRRDGDDSFQEAARVYIFYWWDCTNSSLLAISISHNLQMVDKPEKTNQSIFLSHILILKKREEKIVFQFSV